MSFFNKHNKEHDEALGTDLSVQEDKKALGKTFIGALFVGIIIILASIILNDMLLSTTISGKPLFLIGIVSDLLKSLGIAIIIAYFFTYISGTKSFVEFIKKGLISIIVTKDFLNKLNDKERREMLNIILRPKNEIATTFSGINDYFNKQIKKSLSLFETHFRTSYQLNAVAKIDKKKNVVCVEAQLTYRMYKVSGKFENMNVGYEDEDIVEQPLEIFSPKGEKYVLDIKTLDKKGLTSDEIETDFKNDPSLIKGSIAYLTDELKQYDYLDTNRKMTEYGNDHWHLFTLRITQPCDKFSIYLVCEDDLVIKKYVPFGKLNSFNIECQDNKKVINIFCHEWMESGLGVAILIAKNTDV
jgi:hypothetical protein